MNITEQMTLTKLEHLMWQRLKKAPIYWTSTSSRETAALNRLVKKELAAWIDKSYWEPITKEKT